jgi:DNA-binding MarR family transcriptional regulator
VISDFRDLQIEETDLQRIRAAGEALQIVRIEDRKDIGVQALLALFFIATGAGRRVQDIADLLGVTPGGASKILDDLSDGRMVGGQRQPGLGLISRRGEERKHRHDLPVLTPKGVRRIRQIAAALSRADRSAVDLRDREE